MRVATKVGIGVVVTVTVAGGLASHLGAAAEGTSGAAVFCVQPDDVAAAVSAEGRTASPPSARCGDDGAADMARGAAWITEC